MKNVLIFSFFFLMLATLNAQEKSFKIGDTVPDFKLWLTDGSRLTQDSIKGKVVVFKFWFTACLPCVVDIPTLNELVDELKDRDDILFIAPALDRKDAIDKFLYTHTFNFKIAYSAMDVNQKFNTNLIYPSYFVIDKKGELVYIDSNSKQSHFAPFKKAILKALKE